MGGCWLAELLDRTRHQGVSGGKVGAVTTDRKPAVALDRAVGLKGFGVEGGEVGFAAAKLQRRCWSLAVEPRQDGAGDRNRQHVVGGLAAVEEDRRLSGMGGRRDPQFQAGRRAVSGR